MINVGESRSATSDTPASHISASRSRGHSFPFQLQSLARKWSSLIPNDAYFDFDSVEDAIEREQRQLDAAIGTKLDLSEIHKKYETCRMNLSWKLTAAASKVSNALIRHNVTAPTHREAFKEYADLQQKALNFLIDRSSQVLNRYRQEFPGLGRADPAKESVLPTEHICILNEFVDMTRDLSWVHERHAHGSGRDLIVIDYDLLELGLIQACMALAYIVLIYALPTLVHFIIVSIGVNQSNLTAFLVTAAWPLYVFVAVTDRNRRLRPHTFLSLSMISRGLVLSGLSTSFILLQTLAIHGIPLHFYLILFAMSGVLIDIAINGQYRLPAVIATTLLASVAIALALASTPDLLLGILAMVTAILSECYRQAKLRLFRTRDQPINLQAIEADAISSVFSFVAIIVILSSCGDWAMIRTATRSIPVASWPAFLAVCLLIAVAAFFSDYIGSQLEADGRVNLNVLKAISYGLSITFGIGLFRESYTPVSMSAVVISIVALVVYARPAIRLTNPAHEKTSSKMADNHA